MEIFWNELVLEEIFLHLQFKELQVARSVNRLWKTVSEYDSVWFSLAERFGSHVGLTKKQYIERFCFDVSNIDDNIEKLVDSAQQINNGSTILQEKHVTNICLAAKKTLMKDPMLINLNAPVTIIGNTCAEKQYLFLGNYVGRGLWMECNYVYPDSISTMLLLLCYKIKYPTQIFLLRGGYDSVALTRSSRSAFYEECKRKYSIKMWKLFMECFKCMPVTAVVENKIFCCNGGLSPELDSLEQINKIQRPVDIPNEGLLCDLVWSDPADDEENGWHLSDRGVSYTFSKDILWEFLNKFQFELLVRSNQVVQNGFQFRFDKKLVTIFSVPNMLSKTFILDLIDLSYKKGEWDNIGAYMNLSKNLEITFSLIEK